MLLEMTYYHLSTNPLQNSVLVVIRVILYFGPPAAMLLLLLAACRGTFQIGYVPRGWSAWLGNNGQFSPDVRSGSLRLHRHKCCSLLDHDSRPKSFPHPQRRLYTVCEASVWSVSSDGGTTLCLSTFSGMSSIVAWR